MIETGLKTHELHVVTHPDSQMSSCTSPPLKRKHDDPTGEFETEVHHVHGQVRRDRDWGQQEDGVLPRERVSVSGDNVPDNESLSLKGDISHTDPARVPTDTNP